MKIPKEWSFHNKDVADGFDSHVKEQLPWYELATSVVAHIARHYIPVGGIVYDLGASTGNIGRSISEILASRGAIFYPIESSKEMCEKYNGPGKVENIDIRDLQIVPYDLCIAFLVFMFIPVNDRNKIIRDLKSKIKPGGALIVFDKIVPASGYISTILWRLTLAGKVLSGVPANDIIEKELSLSGVQRPLSILELPGAIECFRFGDFCGWIIEPEAVNNV